MPESAQLTPGAQLVDPTFSINLIAQLRGLQAKNQITALAGGGRSASTPALTNGLNEISVCATNADSVLLPNAIQGSIVLVRNAGAANAQVFARGSDTINGTAGNVGVAQNAATSALYFCPRDGVWYSLT